MALSLPYPNSPQDGDAFLSQPIRSNINAITQAVQSFDGSQVQAGSIAAAALAPAANPITRGAETLSNFVSSGCFWAPISGLNGTMASGVIYINGIRVLVSSIASRTFAASSDTYVDVDYLGNVYYLPVGNGAASPNLTGNSIRTAKIVTNATIFTNTVQNGSDSIGNIIYPLLSQNLYKFSVYRSSSANGYMTTVGSNYTVPFDVKLFDTGNNFNVSTYQFTCPVSGYYQFNTIVTVNSNASNGFYNLGLFKNGATVAYFQSVTPGSAQGSPSICISKFVQCNINDVLYVGAASAVPNLTISGGTANNSTYFEGFLVSRT